MANDLLTRIDNTLDKVKDNASAVYADIIDLAYYTSNYITFVERAFDYEYIDRAERGKYYGKLYDALYRYLETITYLKQSNSELGSISNALAGLAKGTVSIEDALDILR